MASDFRVAGWGSHPLPAFQLREPPAVCATFTGLLPAGVPLSDIVDVEIEIYHVFPTDSLNPPSGNVPTRPGQFTGGEGPATGQEVLISATFNLPIVLDSNHYFFRPEVQLSDGSFLWLSAPKQQFLPGTNVPDLQSWIRNDNLAPDWLRVGTDITHQGPFDAAFSLSGVTVAEPSALLLLGTGLLALMAFTFIKKAYIS